MWVGVPICPQISLCFPISNFIYNLTFNLSVFFFGLFYNSFIYFYFSMIRKFALGLQPLSFLQLYIFYCFIVCTFTVIAIPNRMHKCLFLPSEHWFINYLDLLIYSFLHFHWRIYVFECVCEWESPKAFLVHFWLTGQCLPCSSFSMVLLGSGIHAREIGDN